VAIYLLEFGFVVTVYDDVFIYPFQNAGTGEACANSGFRGAAYIIIIINEIHDFFFPFIWLGLAWLSLFDISWRSNFLFSFTFYHQFQVFHSSREQFSFSYTIHTGESYQ